MSKNNRQKILKRTISTRRFKIGMIVLILAPILSFASINMNVVTVSEEGHHEWSAQGGGKLVRLPGALEPKSRILYIRFISSQNLSVTLTIEGAEEKVVETIELQPSESITINLTNDSRYLIIPSGSEYFGSSVEYSYSMDYYEQPYSLLAFPAFFSTIIGIYLIYSSHTATAYTYIEEQTGSEVNCESTDTDYTPPTLFDRVKRGGDDD